MSTRKSQVTSRNSFHNLILTFHLQTNASKVDNVLDQNPGKTLDQLVAARKINADQKAQILKKPALQASLTQLEEQIAQYKKFDQEYKARTQAEKAAIEKEFTEKSGKQLEEAVAAAKTEAAAASLKEQQENLLVLSKFLRLAASRRAADVDQALDENQALEGVLVEVYAGDMTAVVAMEKLVNGSDKKTKSIGGDQLNTTCKSCNFPQEELASDNGNRCANQGDCNRSCTITN